MSQKIGIISAIVVLCFLCVQEINANSNTCTYLEKCWKIKTTHGHTYMKKKICIKKQPCETTWNQWSSCTRSCGGGYRIRFGTCVGTECRKLVKEIERCNIDPCPTTTPSPTTPTTSPPPPPSPSTTPSPTSSTTTPPPPPSVSTSPTPTPTTPSPPSTTTEPIDDCSTTWRVEYEHDDRGNKVSGNLTQLLLSVSKGAFVKVWDKTEDVVYTTQTVLELDGNLCSQVFFDLSLSGFDSFEDDLLWNFRFLCTTGDQMFTNYEVGAFVNRGIRRQDGDLAWLVRDNIPATPVYSTNVVHAGDDGDIGTLIDFIRKGADFRLVIGNGLRIPAANLEIDENATKVVEMGIFESSRQVVDSKGNDIYEFLSSGMDVWWFTLRSSEGSLNLDRWKIGEHERTETSKDTCFCSDWYVDSCWSSIYKRDANGSDISGSLNSLISAAETGSRVKVLIGSMLLEADDIRIEDGVLCASFLNRLTKESFDTLDPDIAWFWTLACSSGQVRFQKYQVGNTKFVDFGRSRETIEWFVDGRKWTTVLVTDPTGNVESGSKLDLIAAVQNGSDIRYRIHATEEIAGFALSNTTIIQQPDNLRWIDDDEVSAMHIRSVGITSAGLGEVEFIRSAYWCFSLLTTEGKLEVSRWYTGIHVSLGKNSYNVRVEWFESK